MISLAIDPGPIYSLAVMHGMKIIMTALGKYDAISMTSLAGL
jgi:hypothetical protein